MSPLPATNTLNAGIPAIDPSLAGLSSNDSLLPPLNGSTAHPPSFASSSSFPSTSISSTAVNPYDLPHPLPLALQSSHTYSTESDGQSATLAHAYALPAPPADPFGTSSYSAASNFAAARNPSKGKGRAVDRDLSQDIVVHDPEPDSPRSAGATSRKRARSASFGSSGLDGEEDEKEEEEDGEEEGGASPARTASAAPARHSRPKRRPGSLASRVDAAGGLERISGKRVKYKGLGGKKGVVLPLVPKAFRGNKSGAGEVDGAHGKEGEQDVEELLQKARDPAFAANLLASLTAQQDCYTRAYQALNDELFKAQVEESVLNNVKLLVLKRRDEIRYTERKKATAAVDNPE
ncbi:hypothetical protein JCM6882_009088 [Rhodosporidiobolus microsporus]